MKIKVRRGQGDGEKESVCVKPVGNRKQNYFQGSTSSTATKLNFSLFSCAFCFYFLLAFALAFSLGAQAKPQPQPEPEPEPATSELRCVIPPFRLFNNFCLTHNSAARNRADGRKFRRRAFAEENCIAIVRVCFPRNKTESKNKQQQQILLSPLQAFPFHFHFHSPCAAPLQ